jgi:uncharacterized protein YgbK (DUF1537 family)
MRLAIVADDLTGAADTGVQFARIGLPARVWLADGPIEDGATVFDTDSRSLAPADAAARVGALAERLRGVEHVYKKVDSTVRGNVGAEVAASLRALGRRLAVLAPAFPANRRTTVGGVQRVDGVPVHESSLARDPAHPVRHATIAAALRDQCDLEVAEVSLSTVRDGARRLGDLLGDLARDRVGRVAVVDAESDDDLAAIAGAIARVGERCLPVGSAGLAGQIAAAWGLSAGRARPPARRRAERILFVCGSLNPASRAQIAAVHGPTVEVIRSDAGATDAVTVAAWLGRAASQAIEARRPDALVLTGGDTARAVLGALGARGIALDAEVLPGVPLGRVLGGRLDGATVVTKAGGFGGPDTLVRVQRYLQESIE